MSTAKSDDKNHPPGPGIGGNHPFRDEITPRQREVFTFLFETTMRTGIQPSFRDICVRFGFKSQHAVQTHFAALARKGWIAPTGFASRSIRFLKTPDDKQFVGFSLPDNS